MSESGTERSPRIRAVIVDDEPLARDCIRLAVDGEADLEVVAECGTGEEAVAAIRELDPDLVFLDVQMPGMDGFDVIEAVGAERMPSVVFVTAFDEHALHAFQVHALDYVLKPFDDARFQDAVEHARHRLAAERDGRLGRSLAALLGDLHGPGADQRPHSGHITRLMVRARDRILFVPVDDVDWFEAAGNYIRLHAGETTHLVRMKLSVLERQLEPGSFVRIHRSTIVNLERIAEVQAWAGGDYIAILMDGTQLRVSRTYRDALLRPAH